MIKMTAIFRWQDAIWTFQTGLEVREDGTVGPAYRLAYQDYRHGTFLLQYDRYDPARDVVEYRLLDLVSVQPIQ